MEEELIKYLESFITPRRNDIINKNLLHRTRYITVLLEDLYQSQNASAVARSCECFGIQDIHIVENRNLYELHPDISLGSDKWLSMHMYNSADFNTPSAIDSLRKKGYRIVATAPGKESCSLDDFDISKGKVALLFGTELNGLSDCAMDASDEFISIPIYGFTESFNISVSVGIILHHLTYKLKHSDIIWNLEESEMMELKLHWLRSSIKNCEFLEKRFFNKEE